MKCRPYDIFFFFFALGPWTYLTLKLIHIELRSFHVGQTYRHLYSFSFPHTNTDTFTNQTEMHTHVWHWNCLNMYSGWYRKTTKCGHGIGLAAWGRVSCRGSSALGCLQKRIITAEALTTNVKYVPFTRYPIKVLFFHCLTHEHALYAAPVYWFLEQVSGL